MPNATATPVRKIVFVVGAGASKEVGLPVAKELKETIATALNICFNVLVNNRRESGDSTIAEALRLVAANEDPPTRDINPHLHAAWQIRDAMVLDTSIDNFINTHPG